MHIASSLAVLFSCDTKICYPLVHADTPIHVLSCPHTHNASELNLYDPPVAMGSRQGPQLPYFPSFPPAAGRGDLHEFPGREGQAAAGFLQSWVYY